MALCGFHWHSRLVLKHSRLWLLHVENRDFLFSFKVIGYFNGYFMNDTESDHIVHFLNKLLQEPLWTRYIGWSVSLLISVLFIEGCHQSIGLPSGLPSFACMNVLAFSLRSHRSQGDTDRDVALNAQNVQNVCLFQMLFWPTRTVTQLAFLCILLSLSFCLHFIHFSTVYTLQEPVWILAFPNILL